MSFDAKEYFPQIAQITQIIKSAGNKNQQWF